MPAGLRRGAVDAEVVHLRALHRRAQRGVAMNADEHVGLLAVRVRRSIVERHRPVVVSCEKDAQSEARFDQRAHAPRHRQRDVFFQRAAGALRAEFVAAVAWIDDDGAHARGRHRQRQRRRSAGGGAAGGDRRAGGSVPGGSRSITTRELLASGCEVVARCMPNFGPVIRRTVAGVSPGCTRLKKILRRDRRQLRSSASASNATTSRPGSLVTRAGVPAASTSKVTEALVGLASTRATTRGTRRSPTITSRALRRSSMRVSSADPARVAESRAGSANESPCLHRRGGQRHQPPADRDHRLIGGENDRLVARGNRHAPAS